MLSATQPWASEHFSLVERVWAGTPSPQPSAVPAAAPAPPNAPYRPPPGLKNELFKTEMCRSYVATAGFCRYGAKCQFAHGLHELRPVRRHPRYKTKLCRNWNTHGSCPYGIRCRFIHSEAGGEAAGGRALAEDGGLGDGVDGEVGDVGVGTPAWAAASTASAVVDIGIGTRHANGLPSVSSLPAMVPPVVATAYDAETHGPLSHFTRELLADLPSPASAVRGSGSAVSLVELPATSPVGENRASPPRLAVFEDIASGHASGQDFVGGDDGFGIESGEKVGFANGKLPGVRLRDPVGVMRMGSME